MGFTESPCCGAASGPSERVAGPGAQPAAGRAGPMCDGAADFRAGGGDGIRRPGSWSAARRPAPLLVAVSTRPAGRYGLVRGNSCGRACCARRVALGTWVSGDSRQLRDRHALSSELAQAAGPVGPDGKRASFRCAEENEQLEETSGFPWEARPHPVPFCRREKGDGASGSGLEGHAVLSRPLLRRLSSIRGGGRWRSRPISRVLS